ncbi:TRAP transporter small permease [Kiloniella laminariae]|uniref:TRAP transporter small permease protein n=1 Tax=Kiloniella laminariae TaxID=454162 RepID=A0ABT4LK48_9PROT|nr:TRAP transporter small permease [Kiloniella laminariae]MCZ4281482.1 TRAP transporter small permease [Kiloniella laminariae]
MDYRDRYPLVLKNLSTFIDLFLAIGGLAVLILIFTNVVLRGAAGFDLAWSLEITAFLLLWLTFMGCAAATARGAHMRVTEIVDNLFSPKFKHLLEIAINLFITLLLISLIYHGYNISLHTWAQKTTVLYWPVGFLYAALPVGILFTLIFHLYNFYLDIRHGAGPVCVKNTGTRDWEDYE